MTDLPTYVVLVTRTPDGVRLTDMDTASRVVGIFKPCGGSARYLDALGLRDRYRSAGWWALVVDQRDLWLYTPNA